MKKFIAISILALSVVSAAHAKTTLQGDINAARAEKYTFDRVYFMGQVNGESALLNESAAICSGTASFETQTSAVADYFAAFLVTEPKYAEKALDSQQESDLIMTALTNIYPCAKK